MNINEFEKLSDSRWQINPRGPMRVPAIIHASEDLILGMDDKVREQLVNVTTLPGIVGAAHAMPDAHWGYGFPIGGVPFLFAMFGFLQDALDGVNKQYQASGQRHGCG